MIEALLLRDTISSLLEQAHVAKATAKMAEATSGADSPEAQYAAGRLMGYYEVLSSLLNRLDAFGVSLASVGLSDTLDLEHDLFGD